MKPNRQFGPDAETPASGGSEAPARHQRAIPKADLDFRDVSKAVAASWSVNPQITLLYTTPAALALLVASYDDTLMGRIRKGSNRPSQTQTLEQLDDAIDTGVTEVKVYIQKKFKTANAEAQFPRYGITHEAGSYRMARDRNRRLAALTLMVESIDADGFANEEYGKDFWIDTSKAYDLALEAANTNDGSVSTGVSGKNNLKREINKIMKSLRRVIEGNYPETYKATWREWGWQKEDY